MAKEVAIGKRLKISKAQRYTVLGAGIFMGTAFSLITHFTEQISFNSKVASEEDQAIKAYSNAIKNIGVCKSPAGETYTSEELKKCNPNSISVSSVPNSLRSNVLVNMANNSALGSVPKDNMSSCTNAKTGKAYTYSELEEIYNKASNSDDDNDLIAASELIQSCSSLRIIPDALPAFKNEEALLSSLNKIFLISNWEPESLSPTGSFSIAPIGKDLNLFSVRLSVEADAGTTRTVLNNIERSIREFNIERATIEWGGNNSLILKAEASAYYMAPVVLVEVPKTIKVGDK